MALSPKAKKWMTYTTIGFLFGLSGVEYAVILPTLWLYISERFEAEEYFLGLILSAFSFSGLFAAPLMGRWYDYTKKVKWILLFANLWEISGNLMYFFGLNKWFILSSRLVAGIGTGASAAVVADVSRATTKDERTAVLSMFMVCRQFGLVVGPAFNLFLAYTDFKIGPFKVDAFTSPGLFMAFLWCLLEVMTAFMYFDLPAIVEEEKIKRHINYSTSETNLNIQDGGGCGNYSATTTSIQNAGDRDDSSTRYESLDQLINSYDDVATLSYNSIPNVPCSVQENGATRNENYLVNPAANVNDDNVSSGDGVIAPTLLQRENELLSSSLMYSNDMIESAERFMSTATDDGDSSRDWNKRCSSASYQNYDRTRNEEDAVCPPAMNTSKTLCDKLRFLYNEYVQEEIVVILFAVFASFFNQVGLETMVTPITAIYLNWREFENSLLYFIAGIEIIIMFLVVRCMSKFLLDSTIIIIGYIIEVVSLVWLIYYFPRAKPGDVASNLAPFIVGTIADVMGLPLLVVCTMSLYSKITKPETQGLSHGIRSIFIGLATILGPLWTGGMIKQLYAMFGVMLFIMLLAFLILLVSLRRLRKAEVDAPRNSPADVSSRSATPTSDTDNDEHKPLLA
ncbi:uncharacterized protein LOC141908124 [Tubulanus polymorphus]|uniref:uncharacterized protein LOC141908124 n=1 Tax=Tubulanus polymorphus TaxID=672921 RepID=UPI003DA5E904